MRHLLCLVLLVQALLALPVTAQDCVNPNVQPPTAAWPQNAIVWVYAGNVPASLHNSIRTVLNTWNGSAGHPGNDSGVYFEFTTNTTTMDYSGGSVVNGGAYIIQLKYQVPPTGAVFGGTVGQSYEGSRVNALIWINPGITENTAFRHTLSHEIGHTFGLDECYSCTGAWQSVMVGGNPAGGMNDPYYGATEPTSCDLETIKNNKGYTYPSCDSYYYLQCKESGAGNLWDFTRCLCVNMRDPGNAPVTGTRNCWTNTYETQRRVGVCTYYLRIIDTYCGGVGFNHVEYVEDLICEEIG